MKGFEFSERDLHGQCGVEDLNFVEISVKWKCISSMSGLGEGVFSCKNKGNPSSQNNTIILFSLTGFSYPVREKNQL